MTACTMAAEVLQAGRSVAVVDCDFQAPVLHTIWQRAVSPGLSSVLVGARAIDDVFDYRALPTGRFLTVTAGAESAYRSHLFSAPAAELAVRRLVDFAEIVLVNVGPLSAPHATSIVALCDAVVVVADADPEVQGNHRPDALRDLRVPIMAWTPDHVSTPDEVTDHVAPAPAPEPAAVGAAPAPEPAAVGAAQAPEPAPVAAAPVPEVAAVGAAPVPELVPGWIDDHGFEPAAAGTEAVAHGVSAGDTLVQAEPVAEPPPVDDTLAFDAAGFELEDLADRSEPADALAVPGSRIAAPAEPNDADNDQSWMTRRIRRFRSGYLP